MKVMEPRKKNKNTQLNISLPAEQMTELIVNLATLIDGERVVTWSEAVAEAARIAAGRPKDRKETEQC